MSDLNPALIVFLIILGAGMMVMIGYAVHRLFGYYNPAAGDQTASDAQQEHMRNVRMRNLRRLQHSARDPRSY